METIGRGVLDTPPARGMTALCSATAVDGIAMTAARMPLPQQQRVHAVHHLGRVRDRFLQRTGVHSKFLGKEPRRRDVALRISSSFAAAGSGFVLRNVFPEHAFVALQSPFAIRPLGEPVGDADLRIHCAGAHGDAGLVTRGDDLFHAELSIAEDGDERNKHDGLYRWG